MSTSRKSLSDAVYKQITELCAKGDAFAEERQSTKAFECFRDALQLVPEPNQDWEATTWIMGAVGDLYFNDGYFEDALATFSQAVHCAGGLGNPFIHLRLGQCNFELGRLDRAADELTRAYMGGGRGVFKREDPKYLQFLATRIKPPVGQSEL